MSCLELLHTLASASCRHTLCTMPMTCADVGYGLPYLYVHVRHYNLLVSVLFECHSLHRKHPSTGTSRVYSCRHLYETSTTVARGKTNKKDGRRDWLHEHSRLKGVGDPEPYSAIQSNAHVGIPASVPIRPPHGR